MATKDVQLGGVSIAEGDQLIVMLCGANRDSGEFPPPTDFDIERHPNRHLSFGAGVHRLPWFTPGRIELVIALEEIHPAGSLTISSSSPIHTVFHSSQVRGCARLPIRFTPET